MIILTKNNVVFKKTDGSRVCLGDRNITVSLDKNDYILNQIAKKLDVDIQDIMDCFGSYADFFEKRDVTPPLIDRKVENE